MLSRALHNSDEVFMGENMLMENQSQPKGHYEDLVFLRLNEDILTSAGGSWDNPPSEDNILACMDTFEDRIKKSIANAKNTAEAKGFISWGFKDPRTCLTLPLFIPYLDNPRLIVSFRDSNEVAESLVKRDGMKRDKAISLCLEYNSRIKKHIDRYG